MKSGKPPVASWTEALKKIEEKSYALIKEKQITPEDLRPYVLQAVVEMVESLITDASKNGSSADVVGWVGHAWGGPEDAHIWLLTVIKKLGR